MPIPDVNDSPMELVDSAPKVDAPSPEKPEEKVEVKPESPDPVKPEEPAVENLFELPDGRKVDAATLQKEWKENFLPDYTRKSQRVAEFDRVGKDVKSTPDVKPDQPKWKSPDYVPENYAEVIELATAEAEKRIQEKGVAEQERIKTIQAGVEGDLNEIRKTDPKLDENALFQHANKYGFQDLKTAYANMKDIRQVAIETEQRVLKNLKGRDADPIAGNAGGSAGSDEGVDMGEISGFSNALEYLARVKGNK